MTTQNEETSPAASGGRRMTLSAIVEKLLERGGSQHSSIDLGLTASGKRTIGVSIRTSPDGEVQTAAEATELAQALFDELEAKYREAPAATETGSEAKP